MSDIVERLRDLSRCNTHLLDGICDCDDCNTDRIDACRDAAKEIERLRGLLSLARAYVHANQGGWCRDGVTSDEVLRLTAADQPNGATGWIDNAVTPPGESVERVLVAYPTGLVETTQAHYVRLYPTNYPWWMPLPVAPDPTPQPQPDAVASTFADCETAMGMEYTTPPCACAEYYPGLPHHPDCPTRNADPTKAAP